MNPKRKVIFKDAFFVVPFLLIASVITLAVMFKIGRNPYDIDKLITKKFHSNSTADISRYLTHKSDEYTVKYYYGDDDESVMYAEYKYEGRGDHPETTLTLYEARDGFDAGVYSVVWSLGEEYVTYTPPNSTVNSADFEKYLTSEVPLMYNLVTSYSWEGLLNSSGASDGNASGHTFLGIRLFSWDHEENGVLRGNFLWGIGGNPCELYSYIQGSQGEYKKAVLK